MRAWSGGDLPIVVAPLPGEALDSWLEAYARRLAVTTHALLSFIGLLGARPATMTQRLQPGERDALHGATGLGASALTQMTLQPYEGLTVSSHPSRRGMGRPPAWRYHGAHSRYCPACLHQTGGRWLLAWRQPWSFACTLHHCLLLERCPACHNLVRANGTRVGGPTWPAMCTRGHHHLQGERRLRLACGYPLSTAATPALPDGGLVLAAQHYVNALMEDALIHPAAACSRLQDLYCLGWRALSGLADHPHSAPAAVHHVLGEVGGDPPAQATTQQATDARSIAVGTTLARLAAPAPDPDQPELLDWLIGVDRGLAAAPQRPSGNVERWKTASPRLTGHVLAGMDATLTFTARIRYATAGPIPYFRELEGAQLKRRAAAIPGELWPSWMMRLLPPALVASRSRARIRYVASTLLLLPGTRLDYRAAGAMLGHHSALADRPRGDVLLAHLPHDALSTLASVLIQLAWALDRHGAPIDYARRRALITPATLVIDEDQLRGVYAELGWRQGDAVRRDRIRRYLLALLRGADPGYPQSAPGPLRTLRRHMPHALREFLDTQATVTLTRLGIDEPLRWEPPPSWATAPTWPGFDPETRDHLLPGIAGPHPLTVQDLAEHLDLPRQHLDLYGESRAITLASRVPVQHPTSPRRTRSLPRTGALAPDRLRTLYQEQGLTQSQIARIAGCSSSTISAALTEAGIALRPRRANGSLARNVPRAWLEREYTHKGRSSPDIARELGVHKNAVIKLLKRYGIPRQHDGLHSNPFAPLTTPLSAEMEALSRTHNILQRLRHLTHLPGQRNLASAAAALGTTGGNLSYQLSRVEETLGFAVIDRTRPLAATEAGQVFLDEVTRLLNLLKDHAQ